MQSDCYRNGYFNIQDIMASQERISCKFEIDVTNMGFLDSSSHDSNIKVGSKLDLPYWLVKAIYNEKFKFVNIDLPKWYKKFYHDILEADACVVDLRKMGPYYYDFGVLLLNLVETDIGLNIARTLLSCFRSRFRRIMDLSSQTDHRDLYKAISKLDFTETEIYKAGQSDANGFIRWQRREFCKLLPSIIVTANKNKRKRADSNNE
ncbi:DNA replication complex GINS PSF3-like [Brachionus plicatilis]|uniref:DNA replication complex GINS protein PSF3 n=1 Tax=Brachionus plicatilis TaxID=10195 RepID=A0A3M7SVQ4_BRAPC|nr:DNA replication complex GINS PSF3-like [Brachionus plicatilis]